MRDDGELERCFCGGFVVFEVDTLTGRTVWRCTECGAHASIPRREPTPEDLRTTKRKRGGQKGISRWKF